MAVSIRPAEHADLAQLTELARSTYVAAFGLSFANPDDLQAHLDEYLSRQRIALMVEQDQFLLACRNNPVNPGTQVGCSERLVGFLQFGVSTRSDLADCELKRLYVHGSQQGNGIGSSLMDAFLSHPQLASVNRVMLDVWKLNDGARRFYTRYGFKVAGHKPFEVASGADTSDDLIMVRQHQGYFS
jgi:ribosomal protein S18 acetylase RimI-like enzyme